MKSILPWLLLGASIHAQLRPVSLEVIYPSGGPIGGASVSYAYRDDRVLATGPKGKLDIETEAEWVAISNPGYQTVVLRRSELTRYTRVVLQPHPHFSHPACNLNRALPDWPPQLLYKTSPPKASDVWKAVTFHETALLLNARQAKDVKSVTVDNRHSRYIGNGEESVGYQNVDAATAQQLDLLIERACQVRVSVVVVDPHGHSLDDVIGAPFIGYERETARFGANGTFEGRTTSPHIVFRRYGYQAVVTKPAANLRIVMYLTQPPPFKTCSGAPSPDIFHTFRFPEQHSDRPLRDVDYYGVNYSVKSGSAKHLLRHGSGPTWSFGVPAVYKVSPSIDYEEHTYSFGIIQITDANGTLADGARWRFLGRLGETAEYETKDPEAAKKLDAILDSVCLMPMPPAPPRPGK